MRIIKQKTAVVITGMAVVTLLIAGTALAGMHGKMKKDKDMSGKTGMNKDKPMMQCGMQGGMMKRQVVATDDGGVIIIVGNMLLKYDEDLELVKKATIEISEKDMQHMMKKMKKQCDMCRKMMKDKETNEDE